jgi:transposase
MVPMGKVRRKHSREFKIEAVRQVTEKGRKVCEVARGLGIDANMLSRWKAHFEREGKDAFPGVGVTTAAAEELRELRRRLAIAEQERDILKKAVAYFARDKN